MVPSMDKPLRAKRERSNINPGPSNDREKRAREDRGDSDIEFDHAEELTLSKRQAKVHRMSGNDADSSDDESAESDISDRQFHKTAREKERKASAEKDGKEQDIDMFGDGDDDDAKLTTAKDGKSKRDTGRKRELQLEEIEGQEFDSYNLNQDYANEEELDEDGKPKVRIEAFNMKADLEDGHFDEEGNFVWAKKDPLAAHDVWLQGISNKDIREAREAEQRRQEQERQRREKEEESAKEWPESKLWVALLNLMQPKETTLAAMARLGGGGGAGAAGKEKMRRSRFSRMRRAKGKNAEDNQGMDEEEARQRRQGIEKLTEYSDRLMGLGHFDVHDLQYESIVRRLRIEGLVPDDWVPGMPLPIEQSGLSDSNNDPTKSNAEADGSMDSGQSELNSMLKDLE